MEYLNTLRAATASLHERLDLAVSRHPITTADGYRRFLEMHARLLPSLERWLSGQAVYRDIPDWQARLRSDDLLSDMKALGVSDISEIDMSFLNDNASVPGICYVLEGSRLGAAHLRSLLSRSGSDFPLFFLSHGHGQAYWKTFVQWLSVQQVTPEARDAAVVSATSVFQAYLSAAEMEPA